MNASMVTPHEHAVKHNRFIAPTEEQQADLERQIGRNLYRRGRRITECTTDEMTAGWLAAEFAGADAYYRCMMRQASAVKSVNWNGEVW